LKGACLILVCNGGVSEETSGVAVCVTCLRGTCFKTAADGATTDDGFVNLAPDVRCGIEDEIDGLPNVGPAVLFESM
jgi:hypothetical protein